MSAALARYGLTAVLGVVVWISGCVRPPLPPADELIRDLSYAVLQPDISCARLREDFELEGLPLADTPSQAGIDFEQCWVDTPDGEVLRVWFMAGDDPRGVVVVSSGNTGSMACYLFTARLLVEGGYAVVMYDYEGFGGSSGEASLLTLRSDLTRVVDWARTTAGVSCVSLMGISLGSIPSVAVAVDRPEAVNGVILDSPVALGVQIERFDALLRGRSSEVIQVLETWLLSEQIISQMRQPLLVFLHEEDFVTPASAVELLFERAGGPKELVRFPGLGHARGQFVRTEEYRGHLMAFLDGLWPR